LPFAFGIMLFLVKIVRATNDNLASVFYNATGGLVAYFWIGFGVTVLSLLCCMLLMQIHESVFEGEVEQKKTKTHKKQAKTR
jgi:heme exporter protein D